MLITITSTFAGGGWTHEFASPQGYALCIRPRVMDRATRDA